MDFAWLTGLVTTVAGGAAVVIGALAAYQKAMASRSEERGMLTSIWDSDRVITAADVGRRMLDLVPSRVRRRMAEIVDAEPHREEVDAPSDADA